MVVSINELSEPVGAITDWIRPDNTTPLPYGWLICDGSTVVDSESEFNGKTLPDLRAQFPRGHATLDNSNFASDTLYYTGGTIPSGGVNSLSLGHSHSLGSHRHTLTGTTSTYSSSTPNIFGGAPVTGSHNHTVSAYSNYESVASNTSLGSADNRPAYVETVTIIKIK
jgi:hypothetical protein